VTQLDQSANGKEIELSNGEEFELVLPETRTAGFRWTVASGSGPNCSLLNESSQPSSGAAGGSGTRSWHFRASTPGTCLLALEYKRSWEASSKPTQTFTLKVHIRSEAQ